MADRRREWKRAAPLEKEMGIGRRDAWTGGGTRVRRGHKDGHTPHDFPIRMMCSILSTPSPGSTGIFLRFFRRECLLVVTEVVFDARIGP